MEKGIISLIQNIMANFEKVFIGKGKKIDGYDIVRVTVPLEALQAIAYNYEDTGKDYVTFEVAKMKDQDQFGRTHSCYYSKKLESATKPAPKAKKKSIGKRNVKVTS